MKIAMVGDLTDGGYDVVSLADALARRGPEVRMLTAGPQGAAPAGGFTIDRIPVEVAHGARPEDLMPLIGDIARHLIRAWESARPDVVHCHGWGYGMAAQLAAKRCPVPTVQTFPGLTAAARRDGDGMDAAMRIQSLLVRNATAVTVPCHDDMRDVIRLGCPRARVSVLAPGVEVDDVTAEEIVSRGTEPTRRIVAVARDLTPAQGLAQVLRVLPSLGAAELVLTTTHADDGQCSDQLLDLARKLKIDKRVRLVAGVSGDDLTALFRSADVVVAPALYEPSCATVLQAMACGAPIVATAAGGVRDAVIADVTGLLVSAGRPDALARALRSILGQMVLRQGMGLAGRSRARSRYSWDRIATDAEVVYGSVLDRESAPLR
ncbi:glycosyltransferase [Mycobacterium sp. NAZ190054]|uniref:glycosyltransferase n=1 Tax=Mycobacterium sp. NAZ190054 TaxID=1747766 RepID=UPI000793C7E1|nr:glycosyltransferase [Mycobacterium sp. NAZ190054]KWX57660.1 glycosyl transferase family 1 [Mycobacterium sp. NAZ190054]